jgi:Rrf2 family protein
MRISTKAEYACLAVAELANSGGNGFPKKMRDIAVAQGIPEPYLTKILLELKAAGLIHSSRGSVGGYQLARDASAISVAEVIDAIDGRADPRRKGDSPAAHHLSDVLARALAAEWDILSSTTISDLVGDLAPLDWVV